MLAGSTFWESEVAAFMKAEFNMSMRVSMPSVMMKLRLTREVEFLRVPMTVTPEFRWFYRALRSFIFSSA